MPDEPCYFILSFDADDMDKWYARLETGFVAGNMLLHGLVMGVGCWFTTGWSDSERGGIRDTTGLKPEDVPIAIVSIGYQKWEII